MALINYRELKRNLKIEQVYRLTVTNTCFRMK